MSPVLIRPMRRGDVAAVHAIERQVQPAGWSAAVFRAELERDDRHYVVAVADGIVAGYAGMLWVLDEAHVTNVAVDPARQGGGIGTHLVLELHREAITRGVTAMTLEVRAGNERAKAVYRRFGYAPVGVRPAYYADNGEDALVLWVHDVAGAAHGALLRSIEQALDPSCRAGGGRRTG